MPNLNIHPSRQERIQTILLNELNPSYLIIDNESNRHQVPIDAETHFKIIAVSVKFDTLTRIARHRLVNQLVSAEFNSGMHALSLHLYTPKEWDESGPISPKSPPCQKNRK